MTDQLNFSKLNGLVPAVIQDAATRQVLMVGFMNREAAEKTFTDRKATFWSRTKQRLWQKGETSGNTLHVVSAQADCDGDALLIEANPSGPTCHNGTYTCFGEEKRAPGASALQQLEEIIRQRKRDMPKDSYTATLFARGMPHIAQKVGEEAVEVIVASLQQNPAALKDEAADLIYHLLVLLTERGITLEEVGETLRGRMR
ncbi:MAG TPA: bifunctional phosphoribosyl-AMP cyclohydrolase/phosphoribosyl-ATP diphosphatase HisIE [Bacteroidota bacterium]